MQLFFLSSFFRVLSVKVGHSDRIILKKASRVFLFAAGCDKKQEALYETKYSRMDQVKFVEDSL